jgi:hypothetical protein
MASEHQTGIRTQDGQERDALSVRWKRIVKWRPGERKAAKVAFNKRVRKVGRHEGWQELRRWIG